MRLLYTLLFVVLLPAILVRLWLRGRQLPAYRDRWSERFARFPEPQFKKPVIWLHTVSVGEFIAARPLIDKILDDNDHQLVITTMTPTGSERVEAAYGDRVFHVYAPYDIPVFVNRFLDHIKPQLAIFLETELWPNILRACCKNNIPSLLANARLSEKSARGYRKFAGLTRAMLNDLSLAAIQSQKDADRFIALGLAAQKAKIIGSIKFDINIPEYLVDEAQALKAQISENGKRKVWIAASTHHGEDEIVLDAFSRLLKTLPDHRLMLVPRHPDRFEKVYQLCCARGFATIRRSQNRERIIDDDYQVLLGDTMGEMMLLFGCADAAFVGGSLIENGGHNTIEPAIWGLPLLSGPSQFNFAEVSRLLHDAEALKTVTDANRLAEELEVLLTTERGKTAGDAAREVALQNQGALKRLLALCYKLLR